MSWSSAAQRRMGLRRSVLHHRYGMLPDVPIVVRVVLVKAEHGASSGIGTANTSEKPRKTAAAPFPQSIFVSSDWTRSAAISLSRSLFLWDGRGRGVFDLHSVYRSKAQSPKHPQAILPGTSGPDLPHSGSALSQCLPGPPEKSMTPAFG